MSAPARIPLTLFLVVGALLAALASFDARGLADENPAAFLPAPLWIGAGEVLVLWSCGVHGHLEPCGCSKEQIGGIARRATLLSEVRRRDRAVIHVDAGDLFFESLDVPADEQPQAKRKAELFIDVLNRIGLDAFTPGERDLALGASVLAALAERSRFPWLSANLRSAADGKLLFAAHRVIERGGHRVGIVGVTDPALVALASTEWRADPMLPALTAAVAELEAEKVDVIVALVHTSERAGAELARAVPAIDVVAGVHGQEERLLPGISRTPIVKEAESSLLRGKALGGRVFDVAGGRRPDGRYEVRATPAVLSSLIPDDPDVRGLINAYLAELAGINGLPPEDAAPYPSQYLGATACAACHKERYDDWSRTGHARAWETLVAKGHDHDLDCIGCHSIGVDTRAELASEPIRARLLGVQCEHCHGPRAEHPANPTATRGLKVDRKVCLECHVHEHDDDFDFARDLARGDCIADPPPK